MSQTTTMPDEFEETEASNEERQEKLVPVTEAIRYRKRAQSAEQALDELRKQFEQTRSDLDEAHQTIEHLDRRTRIDTLLQESEAIDLEAARLLTEIAVESMDEPDLRTAVDELRRSKPYLFKRSRSSVAATMSARTDEPSQHEPDRAAEQAANTGNRRDLLRYLRMRRTR